MRSRLIDLADATGELLATAIVDAGGKKILSRGHRLEREDLRLLSHKGVHRIWVVELSPDDRSENELLEAISPLVAQGPLELRAAAGGRIDLIALEPGALVLDVERLRAFNQSGVSVVSAVPNLSLVKRDERFAALRSLPFMAPAAQVERMCAELEAGGPLLALKPIRKPRVSVIYTDPAKPERARELFEPFARRRLERFGVVPQARIASEELGALTRALDDEAQRAADVIVIASTISPLLPSDVIGQAIGEAGGHVTHFLAPVEPGSLLLLAYAGETAIIAPTGCLRSPKPNVLDLILPPLLARHPLTSADIAALGAGGLLG